MTDEEQELRYYCRSTSSKIHAYPGESHNALCGSRDERAREVLPSNATPSSRLCRGCRLALTARGVL